MLALILASVSWLAHPDLSENGAVPDCPPVDAFAWHSCSAITPAWQTVSPDRSWHVSISPHGIEVRPGGEDTTAPGLRLQLTGWGRGDSLIPVEVGTCVARGSRLEIRRGPIIEWYVNDVRERRARSGAGIHDHGSSSRIEPGNR